MLEEYVPFRVFIVFIETTKEIKSLEAASAFLKMCCANGGNSFLKIFKFLLTFRIPVTLKVITTFLDNL